MKQLNFDRFMAERREQYRLADLTAAEATRLIERDKLEFTARLIHAINERLLLNFEVLQIATPEQRDTYGNYFIMEQDVAIRNTGGLAAVGITPNVDPWKLAIALGILSNRGE